MVNPFKRFWRDERGAVTVDWVLLTGGVFALASITYVGIKHETVMYATKVGDEIAAEADK